MNHQSDIFREAQQFLWQAVICAGTDSSTSFLLGELEAVLRGSGALRDAERVSKSPLRDKHVS